MGRSMLNIGEKEYDLKIFKFLHLSNFTGKVLYAVWHVNNIKRMCVSSESKLFI